MVFGVNKWVPALAMVALLLATPAWAQREGRQERGRSDRAQARQQQRMRPQTTQFSGQVIRLKKVEIRGTNRVHVVAQLRTGRDQRKIVDLGLERNLRKLDLRTGDRITVTGQPFTIGDFRIVMANRVRANGEVAELRHARPQRRTMEDTWPRSEWRTGRPFPSDRFMRR